MSYSILDASQFRVKEVVIVTKGGPIDITAIYEEINIFDSLFLPVVSGNILITDALGLSNRLSFDGSEVIAMEIEKTADYLNENLQEYINNDYTIEATRMGMHNFMKELSKYGAYDTEPRAFLDMVLEEIYK